MVNQHKNLNSVQLGRLTIGALLLLTVTFLNGSSAIAQEKQIDSVVLFKPPPDEEQPETTEGAASRQDRVCSQDSSLRSQGRIGDRPKLTALAPQRNYGLTVAERPTFWVYLPHTTARKAILSIKAEGSNPHWQQSIDLTGETGTMGIKLSDDAPVLSIGKNYQWAVILVCGDRPHPNDPVVTAGIKRIDESQMSRNMLTSPRLSKAAEYARHGIWYDALDLLLAEKTTSDNWQDLWVRYLQSGGLAEIAREPVISY